MAWRKGAYSVAATGAGVGTVYLGIWRSVLSEKPPPFSHTAERYDQGAFSGRFKKMLLLVDPSTQFWTTAAIRDAQELLRRHRAGENIAASDEELWRYRQVVESSVHPETNDVVPRIARMSGYLPWNGPPVVGMILSTRTSALLFWNWVNQSMNAAVNYFNRSGKSVDNTVILQSYLTAVTAALGVVYGMVLVIRSCAPPASVARLLSFTAFPASAIASSANCYYVRRPEISTGIPVMSEDGELLLGGELSQAAGRKAVTETVLSRALLTVPVFLCPPVLLMVPPFSTAAAVSPAMHMAMSCFLTMTCFGYGLAAAIAYFPQRGSITREELEEKFRASAPAVAWYNKGL
eukprot:TRINITY_DN70395_c0_g1_i1.p1 TRINITY_DN70395_c0_g1~~TRINITY_DN70395_c0_g1_i1.p1  ORF type:complete len:376 (+),score=106.21 TRINITY_DN70395_c0_g1_i1:83-1129(+)